MKISCPSCAAKYSIADEKVQSRLAKIRCRKCGTSIVIDGNVSPPHVYASDAGDAGAAAPAAPAQDSGTSYSVDLGENDQRQMSLGDIVAAYNAGIVTAETYVWADGFADWTALAQVEEIVAALHAAASHDAASPLTDETSAAAASAAPSENPWDHSAPQPQRGGGVDLFGNVSGAGSEAEQAASPAFAAPVQRAPQQDTGARNESSVLFSLSALTSGGSPSRPSVPVPAAASGGNDDSGLIDLKALTAAAEATAHAPAALAAAPLQSPLIASPLGGSPLGGPAMGMGMGMGMGGVGASIPPYQAKGSKNGLIIGGFLFAAIVAATAIITLGGGSEETPVPPAVPAAAPTALAPAPVAAPVPTASPELPTSDAKPPSTGTEEDPKAPSKPSGSAKPRPTSSKPSTSSSPAAGASPAPAPAAKPKTGKCGCKTDDLMCLMNCAQ